MSFLIEPMPPEWACIAVCLMITLAVAAFESVRV